MQGVAMTDDAITIKAGVRLRTALILAILADALQVIIFPLFVAGAGSPADESNSVQCRAGPTPRHAAENCGRR